VHEKTKESALPVHQGLRRQGLQNSLQAEEVQEEREDVDEREPEAVRDGVQELSTLGCTFLGGKIWCLTTKASQPRVRRKRA